MLFGFLLVRVLLVLVKGFGRLPAAVSRAFAAALNAGTRPFHLINYLCALPGSGVLGVRAMKDSWTARSATCAPASPRIRTHLALAMHFPTGWIRTSRTS